MTIIDKPNKNLNKDVLVIVMIRFVEQYILITNH